MMAAAFCRIRQRRTEVRLYLSSVYARPHAVDLSSILYVSPS